MFYLRSKTITLCLHLKNLRLLRRLRHRHCNRRCGCSAVRPPRELKHHEGAARIFNHLEAIRLDMQSSKPKASGSTRPKDAPRELSGAVRGATSHCRRRRAFETPAKSANPTSFRSCRELGRRFAISPHGTGGCGKIQARAETWERLLRRHLPRSLLHYSLTPILFRNRNDSMLLLCTHHACFRCRCAHLHERRGCSQAGETSHRYPATY